METHVLVNPLGYAVPVSPVAPVSRIVAKKTKAAGKSADAARSATHEARPATMRASHNTRAALDDMKLGG